MHARLFSAACGSAYGCALSRLLFELDPAALTFWAKPAGIVLTTLLFGAGWLWLTMRFPALTPHGAALLIAGVALFHPEAGPLRTVTLLLGATAMLCLPIAQGWLQRKNPIIGEISYPLFLFALTFALYLRTLAPSVGEADTFEFQVGIARLGIAHGSGYPLLMLVGKVFSWLPVGGTFAFRTNLTSAFFGSAATVVVYATSRKLGTAPLVSALIAFAFGVSPTLWSRAVEIEAYTLNATFVGAILYLCLHLAGNGMPHRTGQGQPQPITTRTGYAPPLLGLLFGLSLTNHLTSLLLAPAVALAMVRWARQGRRYSLRSLLLFVFAFLLGLAVYLYLPLRWPAVNHGEPLSWAQFANIVSGGEAKGAFQPMLPFWDANRYEIVFRKLRNEYGPGGATLALFGLASLIGSRTFRRRSPLHPALFLLLVFLPYLYFALAFNVADPDFSAFLIPLYLLTAVSMGVGLNTVVTLSCAMRNARYVPYLASVLCCLFCLLPVSSLPATLPQVDQSANWRQDEWGRLALSYDLAPNAAILADSDKIAPLYYLQIVEGVRPDLEPIVLRNETAYRTELARRLSGGQTVYLARFLPGLGPFYSLRSVGPLAQVSLTPFRSHSPVTSPPLLRSSTISLVRVNSLPTAHAGESLPVTLYWHASAPADDNYLLSFRLRNAGGIAWQSAGRPPINGLYPTNAWRAGETLSDFHALPLDVTIPPGEYTLEIGLFKPFLVLDSGWIPVMPLTVLAPQTPPTPETPLAVRLGGVWVVGYSAPESATPGAHIDLRLYVRRDSAATQFSALGKVRDLTPWPAGTVIPLSYTLTAPESGTRLVLQLEGADICGWHVIPGTNCKLRAIQLVGPSIPADAVNFGHQLLLRAARLGQAAAAPGDAVPVSLEWQGLRSMGENYAVFVQLVGPDGRLYGQVDQGPVSGSRATSTWKPGEIIHDEHMVRLAADAPAGNYEVHVGLYLLATMQRLPVLSADSMPIDDKVILRGLHVAP